jgi:hypothetical protein
MGPQTTYPVVARNLVVTGLGLGSALAALVVASQNAGPVTQMGVATALATFARSVGGTLGSAGFGSFFAARAGAAATLTPQTLGDALHDTFLASAGAMLVGAVVVLLLRVPVVRARGPAPSTDSRQAVAEPGPGGAGEERRESATRVGQIGAAEGEYARLDT